MKFTGKFRVTLASVKDYNYRLDIEKSVEGKHMTYEDVSSLADASDACRAYIRKYALCGCQWVGGDVYERESMKKIARISYKGRIWDMNDNEIIIS